MPFWLSISILGLVQAALVALPAPRERPQWIGRLSSPRWALVPALSIVVVVGAIEASPGSADALTYIALVAIPPLAAYALATLTRVRENPPYARVLADSRNGGSGWLMPASVVTALFVVAWAAAGSLLGEAAAMVLSGLACVTLGWLLVWGVPAYWLRIGIYAMAAIDTWFVASDLLQGPNAVLSAAAPVADLPRLQAVHFGSALMGFGDLFVAALVGCLLARDRPRQLEAALLVAILALAFDLLFFAVDTLPATVPVALALAIVHWRASADRAGGDQVARGPG
ncbi:MAG TPA: hypothetical protein VFT10_00385 [Solirubrobacterales bacterium]|nr:hypothetical protein [Solirubrobacterales bacterium]